MSSIPLKICTSCKCSFPASSEYFPRDKNKRDGLFSWCKQCKSASDKYYKQLPANREQERNRKQSAEYREYNRNYAKACWADPAKRAVIKARRSTPEYRALDRDWSKALRKKPHYRLLHNISSQKRRARTRALAVNFTDTDWMACLDFFDHKCAVCGRPQGLWHKLAADHWIPLNASMCPGTVPANIIPLCHGTGGCNNSKCDRMPKEWLVRKFGQHKTEEVLKRIDEYFAWLARRVHNNSDQ